MFRYGEDITKASIQYSGKGGVYLDSLQPTSLARIRELENATGQTVGVLSSPTSEAPKFTSQLVDISNLKEGQSAHFEAHVTPVNDPNLVVSLIFFEILQTFFYLYLNVIFRLNGISTVKSYSTVIGLERSTILA